MLSARRLTFTFITMSIAGMALLLPKNVRHFSEVLAAAVLIVLFLCYVGVFLFPARAVHQASDFGGDELLIGDWRGVFGHKNEAGAAMAVFVFIGLFVARARSIIAGAAIIVLAVIFLFFTHSKTSIITVPLAFIISVVMARVRRPILGIALALTILVGMNIFSVGSIYFEPVRNVLDAVLSDPSFTGRNEVWQFAVDRMLQRPFTGYGFAAFWGTPEVVFGAGGDATWATTSGHAHNAYLDLALTIGIPGAILVTLWLVVLPMIDFYRSPHTPQVAALEMLLLQVCLLAACASAFENRLLQEGGASLFLFTAAFGLRFLSVTRVSA